MWPQLLELIPHIARLLPMADRFFQSKTADQEASRTAMQQMAEGLRGDLGQVTASHAGLYRQLNDQSEKLSELASKLNAAKASVDALDARLAVMEKNQGKQTLYLLICLVLLAALFLSLPFWLHHR